MWNNKKVLVYTLCSFIFIGFASAQLLNPTRAYCYNFSWLGPKYTNQSNFNNATCDDVTKLNNDIPCREPLVVTIDGSYPNMTYLMDNHDAEVTCLLTSNEVCASYAYIFDGQYENITYMCTKIVEDTGHSVTSGCYSNYNGNREVRVCACRSFPGPGGVCNSAKANSITWNFLIICIVLVLSTIKIYS